MNSVDQTIERCAKATGWPEDAIAKAQMGFKDIFNNAVIHGNLKLQQTEANREYFSNLIQKEQEKVTANKKVQVKFTINSEKLEFVITDQGNKEFNQDSIPDLTDDQNLVMTSGRGILMTKAFFKDFSILPIKDGDKILGTQVKMAMYKNDLDSAELV